MSNSFKIKIKKVSAKKIRRNFYKFVKFQINSPSEFYFNFLEGEFRKEQDNARIKVTNIERQLQSMAKNRKREEEKHQIGEVNASFFLLLYLHLLSFV